MHIEARQFDLSYLTADMRPIEDKVGRTVGLHVSDIIRDIDNRLFHAGERKPYDQLTDAEKRQMGYYTEMGFIWEQVIEYHFRYRMLHRAEKHSWVTQQEYVEEVNGEQIYGTPDAFDLLAGQLVEMKATWRSLKRWQQGPEKHFWSWIAQIKAYLWMVGARSCRLYVFWVVGDYAGSGPTVMEYILNFTELEIEQNWMMIANHAKTYKETGDS